MLLRCTINGEEKSLEVPPRKSLLRVLREDLGLKSVRGDCHSGVCGSCLVLLDGDPVHSCLVPAFRAEDTVVTTVEGLARSRVYGALRSFLSENRLPYCPYCTPGLLLVVTALLQKNRNPNAADIREALSEILCSCKGYSTFQDAVLQTSRNRFR